jgi:hypothetical protein
MNGRLCAVLAGAVPIAALFPLAAGAQPPAVQLVPVDDVEVFAGPDSPCPFDITSTSTGTVKLTTYFDSSGTPIRQSVHGSLTHTISSAWHTLVSNGPAPVHVDLATGQMVDTGKELAFQLTLAADGSEFSFVGHSVVDTAELCAALAP